MISGYVFGDGSGDVAEHAELDAYVLGFGEDSSGELYALTTESTGPTGTTGKVHKIVAGQ